MGVHSGLRRHVVNFISPRARAGRMAQFEALMQPRPGARILDLGGMPSIWRFVTVPLDVTIVNLDVQQIRKTSFGEHRFTIVQGDATDLPQYADMSFDMVFSNSTIEHVGGPAQQAAFAKEVRRLAPDYYIQTPSIGFPIEAHTGMPFWWYYPRALRKRMIARWEARNPVFGEFVRETCIVRGNDLRRLFPDGAVVREKILGFIKSNSVWRKSAD